MLAVIIVLVAGFCVVYWSRFQTVASIEKLTDYDDGYNLYCMDIDYDYDLDALIARGITDTNPLLTPS